MGPLDYYTAFFGSTTGSLLRQVFSFSVYFLPFIFAYVLWVMYLYYIRDLWIKKIEWVLLEFKLPKEIRKTPQAMEVALNILHQTSTGSLIDQYIKGRQRSWFSLELCSLGGEIHFFLRTPKNMRNLVETSFYAQYPDIEIHEVEDYAAKIPFGDKSEWEVWGIDYQLAKADPFPLKTYVDLELDKDKKEEVKTDPMVGILEFIGNVGPNEQIWIQFLVKAIADRFAPNKEGKPSSLLDEGRKEVNKILKRKEEGEEEDLKHFLRITTEEERHLISAMERNLGKNNFDVGIRALYLNKKGFSNGYNKPGLVGLFRPFGDANFNSFKPKHTTSFDYPWQDFLGMRLRRDIRRIIKYYVLRSYFYPPAELKPIALSTEELATLYHFPGQVAMTPTLGRIPSKRAEPPANLPV